MSAKEEAQQECCPRFEPEPWDGKQFQWDKKRFIKAKVFTFLYMPVNFGGVMRKLALTVENAGANMSGSLCLSDHTSKWNMDVLLEVDREIPGADNTVLSGEFMSKVYEGNFKDTGIWCNDFEQFVTKNGCKIIKLYMWYTTCPKCAKKYGENYVTIIAEVEQLMQEGL